MSYTAGQNRRTLATLEYFARYLVLPAGTRAQADSSPSPTGTTPRGLLALLTRLPYFERAVFELHLRTRNPRRLSPSAFLYSQMYPNVAPGSKPCIRPLHLSADATARCRSSTLAAPRGAYAVWYPLGRFQGEVGRGRPLRRVQYSSARY